MLEQRRSPDLRAYFVWGRYLGTDNESRAREATEKYMAPNSVYFWTAVGLAPRELAATLQIGPDRIPFDVYLLYRRGILWENSMPAPTYWQQQMEVVQADFFDINKMETHIQQLLGR